jgi:poly(3-hydroxyalkanoate) depolymerase
VLCNGIGVAFELLQPFVHAADARIEVVSFDVPGVGGSPTPRLPYRFPGLAWFVTRVLDALGYDRFDVLGISWGGGLAQQLAFQYPRRCRRVVLVSTGTGMLMVPARPDVLSKMATPRRHRDPAYARSIAGELYGGRIRAHPEQLGHWTPDGAPIGSRTGYLFQLLAGVGWTSLPFLPLIRQPTLVLAGTDDPVIPLVNARIMSRLLPHATLHVFDDGHLGLVTSAEELGPVVSAFLL